MEKSSKIDNFLHKCETLVSQASACLDSPKEFEETNNSLNEFFDENWTEFNSLIIELKHDNELNKSFKKRAYVLLNSLTTLENKVNIKNAWVNEFKQYIINSK